MSFSSFALDPRVSAGVEALGFTEPTPIQQHAIPPILSGRDVLGIAQTGTGKTAAFVLPILHRLLDGPRGRLRALVLAPTRELAQQIHEAVQDLGRETGIRSVTIYGGVGMGPQLAGLRRGDEIAVACPGRLLDHVGQRTLDLSTIETVVIDEADRMFDMGFLPSLRRVIRHLPRKRQTLLFSATMPDDVRYLADDVLHDPVNVEIDPPRPASTISHVLYPVEHRQKTDLLLEILRRTDSGPVLVFARTRHRASRLGRQLQKAGHPATSLHGDLTQGQRQAALGGFRDGKHEILVATDIAGRGIDVEGISHVINYDMPDTIDAYTHRVGRTGRAERSGEAFTLVTPDDHVMVRQIESTLGIFLECREVDGFAYAGSAAAPRSAATPAPSQRAPGVRRGFGSRRRRVRAAW